jgi:hypothetical protein
MVLPLLFVNPVHANTNVTAASDVVTCGPSSVAAGSSTMCTKAIVFAPEYVTKNLAGAPSLSQLKSAGFTMAGVIAYQWFESYHWGKVSRWISLVHSAGLTTFVNVRGDKNNPAGLAAMAKLAGGTKADVVALDEPLSWSHMNLAQLQSTISTLASAYPTLRVLINEYSAPQIANAYAWTAKYPNVRVATDEYDNKRTIDYGMHLGQTYAKSPAAWIIFAKGSLNFDSYVHLDSWLTYAKGKNVDVLFWYIDTSNTWRAQWQKVAAF